MSATTSDSKQKSPFAFIQNLLLGGTSGVIAKTACAPLERVKILLQVQGASTSGVKYNGFMDAIVRVPKEQGFAALWRGNLANCLRYFPTQAMNFAFKEKYQTLFVKPKEEVGFAKWFAGYLAAGGAAGATSLTVSYPLEFAFTRLAADTGAHGGKPGAAGGQRQYTGIVDCLRKIVKSDGIRGVYRGYGPSVAGIIVYRAGYFGLYDFAKAYVLPKFNIGQGADAHTFKTMMAKLGLAFTIDVFSALCAYPLDTVRRSMMMMSGRQDKLYTNSMQCFRHIIKNDGWAALYKGSLTNSFRAFGSALVLILYDELNYLFLGGGASKH